VAAPLGTAYRYATLLLQAAGCGRCDIAGVAPDQVVLYLNCEYAAFLQSKIRVYYQYPEISETGSSIDNGGDPAEAVR
jgi:hypothetical protein